MTTLTPNTFGHQLLLRAGRRLTTKQIDHHRRSIHTIIDTLDVDDLAQVEEHLLHVVEAAADWEDDA